MKNNCDVIVRGPCAPPSGSIGDAPASSELTVTVRVTTDDGDYPVERGHYRLYAWRSRYGDKWSAVRFNGLEHVCDGAVCLDEATEIVRRLRALSRCAKNLQLRPHSQADWVLVIAVFYHVDLVDLTIYPDYNSLPSVGAGDVLIEHVYDAIGEAAANLTHSLGGA